MKQKIIFLNLLIIALTSNLKGQQDVLVSQYMFSGMYLNPAYAGTHEYYNATGLFRKQWVGFNGAPTTAFISFDGPLKNQNSGIGGTLSYDQIGVSRQMELGINYSYHLKLNEKAKLSFGLKASLYNYSANLNELTYWDNDVVFENNIQNSFNPNFGFGLYYFSEKSFLGISIPHIINFDPASTLNFELNKSFNLVRSYYLHAGHAFVISPSLTVKPSTLLKYTPNTPFQADFNLNALINELFWIGGSYRTDGTVVGIFEINATKQLRIGYAYGYATSELRNYQSGSHEIMIAFDFGKSKIKMNNPRYF